MHNENNLKLVICLLLYLYGEMKWSKNYLFPSESKSFFLISCFGFLITLQLHVFLHSSSHPGFCHFGCCCLWLAWIESKLFQNAFLLYLFYFSTDQYIHYIESLFCLNLWSRLIVQGWAVLKRIVASRNDWYLNKLSWSCSEHKWLW